MKPTQERILRYLAYQWPRYVSTPELSRECSQTDVRKRISELIRLGYGIEKERKDGFVNYRWTR